MRAPHRLGVSPVLLLVLVCAGGAAQEPVVGRETEEAPPASALLSVFHERFARAGTVSRSAWEEYETLLFDAAAEVRRSRAGMHAAGLALLDLAGHGALDLPRRADFAGGGDRQRVRRAALATLERLLAEDVGETLVRWMADEVLPSRTQHPFGRRLVALFLVERLRPERGKLALLSVGRDEADPLRPAALEIMATWPDEAIDLFLVGLIGRKFDKRQRPHPFNLLLRRVRESEAPLGQRASVVLEERLAQMLLSTDWRAAARALELARGLPTERHVPMLLDALSAWHRRLALGDGSRRIQDDIVRELRRISGKSVGTNPKNWITWWIAVRQGKAKLAEDMPPEQEAGRTKAEFFGLRPVTDRVTFVIDYSGSMATEWGTAEHSRYVEAVEQMMRFLQATGDETRFNVILFSSEPLRSSPHLVRARVETMMRARTSLLEREPGGGTRLRPAVELALRLDKNGDVDPNRLEADTIIVLCDGETEEGPGWVRPLLARVQADAQVKFHCVLIGTKGDGALEALAAETGGDFIRIGG